jgi:hypothetical protein
MVGDKGTGKLCFLSKAKETLMVNLAPKQTNMTPRQTTLLCSALPSPLTVHTIPEIFKETSFYERPTMEKHCCCRRKRRRECEMMVKVGRVFIWEMVTNVITTLNAVKKRVKNV